MQANVTIHRLPVGDKINVITSRKVRQAVRNKLIECGGHEHGPLDVRGIPERYIPRIQEIFAEEYPEWDVVIDDRRVVYRELEDNVAWTDTRKGGQWSHDGYVGKRRLFTVNRTFVRDAKRPYYLSTELPGVLPGGMEAESEREAEKLAERFLKAFLASIGAELKGEA